MSGGFTRAGRVVWMSVDFDPCTSLTDQMILTVKQFEANRRKQTEKAEVPNKPTRLATVSVLGSRVHLVTVDQTVDQIERWIEDRNGSCRRVSLRTVVEVGA